jgi:ribosomal protein L1
MSTPTPSPTPETVVADVHQALDTAKEQASTALAAVEHLDFGAVATEAKQALHDAIEVVKDKIAALFGHGPSGA